MKRSAPFDGSAKAANQLYVADATQNWSAHIRRLAGLGCLWLTWSAVAATNPPVAAVWDNTARVTTGFGYSDNVMRTSVAPESSGFYNVSADASFIRFAESGAYLTFFVLGDYTKYFDAPSVGYEEFFSGTAQAVTPLGAQDELGGEFSYLYQHQVVDVSETE